MRIDQFVAQSARQLQDVGIDTALLDARLLVQYGLGLSDHDMIIQFDRQLDGGEEAHLAVLIRRRLGREPVAHILGFREFWGLPFQVTKDTLVPRPDSETLVEAVLARISDPSRPLHLVDIGTGSGCLLLSLLHELPNAYGIGVDISIAALAVARRNAEQLGLIERCAFVQGDYAAALGGGMDILISNPPYLASSEFDDLDKDVAEFDPYQALVCGQSGLESYHSIFAAIATWTSPPAIVAVEIGYSQADDLVQASHHHGLPRPTIARDLGGRDRVLVYAMDAAQGPE